MTMQTGETAQLWREHLIAHGFTDKGTVLRGSVTWHHPFIGAATALVEIEPDERFPFAPPQVRVLDPGTPLDITFHVERPRHPDTPGNLCLWEDDWPVDMAPWQHPNTLLERITGWLEKTAAGWPGDDDCDLERYLEHDATLVLYDADLLAPIHNETVRVEQTAGSSTTGTSTVVITNTRRQLPQHRRGRPSRKDRGLAWVSDIGEVSSPIRGWPDLEAALGDRAVPVARCIALGMVDWLLIRYRRGHRPGVLAVRASRTTSDIQLRACESADRSRVTRLMRAGEQAPQLGDAAIAVVGCGALGSFAADQLFRSGARHLTLVDGERLRPGNVVRHLAGTSYVGWYKVDAVRDCLSHIDDDTAAIYVQRTQLRTLAEATALVSRHGVVLDATANARAGSLLASAATIAPGHTVLSACVQRSGDVIRVDQLPGPSNEKHLPPLERPTRRTCGSAGAAAPSRPHLRGP